MKLTFYLLPCFLIFWNCGIIYGHYHKAHPRTDSSLKCGCVEEKERVNRIVGGIPAKQAELPWMVFLEMQYQSMFGDILEFTCGATVIHPEWILTAGHCVTKSFHRYNEEFELEIWAALFGENELPEFITDQHVLRHGDSNQVYIHEKFKIEQLAEFDAALIKLNKPLEFSEKIQPICLPTHFQEEDLNGIEALISGWGSTEKEQLSDSLLEEVSYCFDRETCENAIHHKFSMPESVMCAVAKEASPCEGDSGGPVQYKSDNRYLQIGVVSMGASDDKGNCLVNVPSIQTFLPLIMPWIEKTTGLKFI